MNDEEEPMTRLNQNAAMAHELFTAYRQAGFTEDQALKLLVLVMMNGANDDSQ